jgi:predicted O-linked N-acetylglucosamine transferase (SPINDLY family)
MISSDKLYKQGLNLFKVGKFQNALESFEASFRANEKSAEKALLFSLKILEQKGNGLRVMELLQEATSKFPLPDKWFAALAEKHMAQGNLEHAVAYVEQALAINPRNSTAMLNRACWLAAKLGDGEESRKLFEAWGREFMDGLTHNASPLPPGDLSPSRKLRLGYVSGDLKNHSVRYFIEAYLRFHDRQQFEVHAFMTMPEDEVSEWLKPLVDCWHSVDKMDDLQLLGKIRALQIDVLVDLSGHTAGNRLCVFAHRAAPVQVTWFGFMQTLGMKAMDWRLTDDAATPQGSDRYYTESLYRLNTMVSYTPPLNSEQLFDSPWKKNGYVTMVCLNHSRKISDEALLAWAQILAANPRAGLIVISSETNPTQNDKSLERRLIRHGLPMDRLVVIGRMSMYKFMRVASIADFAVDSFPISGGTTTLHALWMGLPTLTLDHTANGARQGATAAIQRGCGLSDAIAKNVNEYVDMANQWIREPTVIDNLRGRCRLGLQSSELMSYKNRVREVELAYRSMWMNYIHTVQITT